MTFKEFKTTIEYICADVVDIYDENGIEFDSDFPEEKLEKMEVVDFFVRSGWIDIVLKRSDFSKIKAVNIEWDIDDEDIDKETPNLPTEIEIPEDIEDEEEISDYLSDVTGFCHKGFDLVEDENECKGCIYDLSDRVETDVEKFNTILDNCCSCKRGKLKEFQDGFPDLYKEKENV